MIDPDVRPATPDDAVELRRLEVAARTTVAGSRGGKRWLDEHAEIGEGWADAIARRTVFVGEIGAGEATPVAVGYIVADLVHAPMAVVRVDSVFVHEEARELGFGDALLAEVIRWGRSAGAVLVEAETLPGDRNLKNLYERAGITARLITVSRVLGPD